MPASPSRVLKQRLPEGRNSVCARRPENHAVEFAPTSDALTVGFARRHGQPNWCNAADVKTAAGLTQHITPTGAALGPLAAETQVQAIGCVRRRSDRGRGDRHHRVHPRQRPVTPASSPVDIWLHYAGAALVLNEPAPPSVHMLATEAALALATPAVTVADAKDVSRPAKSNRGRSDAKRPDVRHKKQNRQTQLTITKRRGFTSTSPAR